MTWDFIWDLGQFYLFFHILENFSKILGKKSAKYKTLGNFLEIKAIFRLGMTPLYYVVKMATFNHL